MTSPIPSQSQRSRHNGPGLLGLSLVALLGAFLALQADAGLRSIRDRALAGSYLTVLDQDLRSDAPALSAAADSVAARAAMARLWVRWANRKEVAGSGQLVDGLRQMMSLPEPGVKGRAVEDLSATGRVHLIRDPSLRARVLRLYRDAERAREEAEADHRGFVHRLEALLPPGTWQHVFQRPDTVPYPVGFLPALEQLLAGGFEGDLRTEARILERYEARLRALAEEAAALRQLLLAQGEEP